MNSPLHDFLDTLEGHAERLGYAVRFCYGGDSARAMRELNWAFAEGHVLFFRLKNDAEQLLETYEIADLMRNSTVFPLSDEILDSVYVRLK